MPQRQLGRSVSKANYWISLRTVVLFVIYFHIIYLFIVYCLSFIVYRLLFITYYLLFLVFLTVYGLLFIVCCSLFFVRCSLFVVCCLFVVYCLLLYICLLLYLFLSRNRLCIEFINLSHRNGRDQKKIEYLKRSSTRATFIFVFNRLVYIGFALIKRKR